MLTYALETKADTTKTNNLIQVTEMCFRSIWVLVFEIVKKQRHKKTMWGSCYLTVDKGTMPRVAST